MFLLTLRTHSLSGPTGAGAELGQLVGGVICSTVLGLRWTKTKMYHYTVSYSQDIESFFYYPLP